MRNKRFEENGKKHYFKRRNKRTHVEKSEEYPTLFLDLKHGKYIFQPSSSRNKVDAERISNNGNLVIFRIF
jgi:hypothetical protein